MRLGLLADNVLERAALTFGRVPAPFLHTHPALLLARALMVAAERGLFEHLRTPTSADTVAEVCRTHPRATAALLDALAGASYLERRHDCYVLTADARRWLLADSPTSLVDSLRFRALEWDWIAGLGDFLDSGEPVDFHRTLDADGWKLYQRAMRSLARLAVPETVRRTPVPPDATDMLDVGGAHGAFAIALCAQHPGLHADVLDLPDAIAQAASLLEADAQAVGVAERVRHQPGDVLALDLAPDSYDLVFVGQLLHHFDEATGCAVVARLAEVLRPGGLFVIQDVMSDGKADQLGALGGLYFALTSAGGTRTFATFAAWQAAASLCPRGPVRFRTLPGVGQQNATKPR